MKKIYRLFTLITALLCFTLCGCSIFRYNNKDKTSKIKVTEVTELTERQKKVLESEGLPTDIDKLSYKQKAGIIHIEKAFEYLDDKYKGVEFEYCSHTPAAIMGFERTDFIPVGYDKEDNRNIVTVKKDRDGNYSDDYMLVAVRKPIENVITKYLEEYFGKGCVKAYVGIGWTDLQYGDEINEDTVIGRANASTALFVPEDICSKEQLDLFYDNCQRWIKDNKLDFHFRAIIISREDFNNTTYYNYGELYNYKHVIYEVNIK